MYNAQDFDAIGQWQVKYENSLEPFHAPHSQVFQLRTSEPGLPSHLGLRCQKSKRVMRRHQETVTNFGTGFSRVVKRLFVQIPIREGTDDVTRFRHRAPVIFRRESKRRCFSSQ